MTHFGEEPERAIRPDQPGGKAADTVSSPQAGGSGQAELRMVDVSGKPVTVRSARGRAQIVMSAETLRKIHHGEIPKGNVLAAARLAAIMAVKRTWEIIPLCHPIPIEGVDVSFEVPDENTLEIIVEVRTTAKTGVEMEALTGAAAGALCVYDMCKALEPGIVIREICLDYKSGGMSGTYIRPQASES